MITFTPWIIGILILVGILFLIAVGRWLRAKYLYMKYAHAADLPLQKDTNVLIRDAYFDIGNFENWIKHPTWPDANDDLKQRYEEMYPTATEDQCLHLLMIEMYSNNLQSEDVDGTTKKALENKIMNSEFWETFNSLTNKSRFEYDYYDKIFRFFENNDGLAKLKKLL